MPALSDRSPMVGIRKELASNILISDVKKLQT